MSLSCRGNIINVHCKDYIYKCRTPYACIEFERMYLTKIEKWFAKLMHYHELLCKCVVHLSRHMHLFYPWCLERASLEKGII